MKGATVRVLPTDGRHTCVEELAMHETSFFNDGASQLSHKWAWQPSTHCSKEHQEAQLDALFLAVKDKRARDSDALRNAGSFLVIVHQVLDEVLQQPQACPACPHVAFGQSDEGRLVPQQGKSMRESVVGHRGDLS
eukprot:scaffold3540_cov379-Prasinococcus_capsulatus_cf.AAC.16